MITPATFFLPELIDNSSYPTCRPPRLLKHQIYDDSNVFEAVDNHAIRVAEKNYPTFRDLLWDLVFSSKFSELEKARVIFRWITACDLIAIDFQVVTKGSPEEKIVGMKRFKTSYASVFELMCRYSGLNCLTINGHVKGVDYHPGDSFNEKPLNHSWNVVFIDESWQLIDSQWATRYVSGKKFNQDVMIYQYDDFYFLMEPQQAVFSHFPQDTIWQLLKEPLSMSQFESLPYIKSQFFKCGMDFNNQCHGVVYSKEGCLKMTLAFSKHNSFTYKLVTDTYSDVFQGIPLKYFVIQETVSDQINFYFRFPTAGVYYLTVFVKELKEQVQPTNHERIMRAACEYKIVADKAAKVPLPFPMSCHDCNWGLQSSLVSYYNLVSSQENGVMTISSRDSKPFVRTEIRFDKLRDEVEILCKLRKNGLKDDDILDQYIEVVEKSDQTIFVLNLPEPDEYALEIYANEPAEEDTFTHIGQYLLDFECPPGYVPKTSVFGPLSSDSLILRRDGTSNIREMFDYEINAEPIGILPKLYLESNYEPDEIPMTLDQAHEQLEPNSRGDANSESEPEMPDFLPPFPPPPLLNVQQFNQNLPTGVAESVSGEKLSQRVDKFHNPPSIDNLINRSDEDICSMTGLNTQSGWSDQQIGPVITGSRQLEKSSVENSAENITKKPTGGVVLRTTGVPTDERRWSDDHTWISESESIQQSDKLQPYLANVERGLSPQLSRKVYGHGSPGKNSERNFTFGKFDVNLKGDSRFSSLSESDLNQKRLFGGSNVALPTSLSEKTSSSNESVKGPVANRGYGRPNFITEPNTSIQVNIHGNESQESMSKSDTAINAPSIAENKFTKGTVNLLAPTKFSARSDVRTSPGERLVTGSQWQKNSGLKTETSAISGVASLKGFFEGRSVDSMNPTSGKDTPTGSVRIPISYTKSATIEGRERTISGGEQSLGSSPSQRVAQKGYNDVNISASGKPRTNVDLAVGSGSGREPGNVWQRNIPERDTGALVNTSQGHGVHGDPRLVQSSTNPGISLVESSAQFNTTYDYQALQKNRGFKDESSMNRDPRYIPGNFEDNDKSDRYRHRSSEHLEESSKRPDRGYLQGLVRSDNPNADRDWQRSSDHLEELAKRSDRGYIQGSNRGDPNQAITDLSIGNEGSQRNSTRGEVWSNQGDHGYTSGSNKGQSQYGQTLQGSIDRNRHWESNLDTRSQSKIFVGDKQPHADEIIHSGEWRNVPDPTNVQVSYRNNPNTDRDWQRSSEHLEESSKIPDRGYIQGLNRSDNSSPNRGWQRSSEHLEELSYKPDKSCVQGTFREKIPGLKDNLSNENRYRRSAEHLEEWSSKSDPKYLSGSIKDKYLDQVDSSVGDKLMRGSTEPRDEWTSKSDQGYLSGSIRVQNSSRFDNSTESKQFQRNSEHREEWSNMIDQSSLRGNTHYKDGKLAVSGEFSQPSGYGVDRGEDSYQSSSYGGDRHNTLSSVTTRLTPSTLKKPMHIEMPSDQYNTQYEDKSRIMPSPMASYRPDESTANWTSGPVQKEPPKNFQPMPIDIEKEVYKPEMEAMPREMAVVNVIIPDETSRIFERIDDHAIQISTEHQDSFNQLIWQLIYARNITDELEKVRVIFLWLCTKDLHKMNFDDTKKDSPEEILMGLKSGKNTYAQIFLTLCRYAGLHCKLIIGYAKGADYVPGMKFEGRHGEHSWNSVLLSGVWRLIDCHWAARRLIGKERKPENVRYELDMFYFLANPSQLIYTHFPHEHDWQLLHHPINKEEFECLAPVKSMFFKYNLDLITHKNAIIDCNAPEFELKIAFPKGVEERILFTFTLTLENGSEEYKGVSLFRYGRHEIDYVNYHSTFTIRAPYPGSFKLLIYAKLISTGPVATDSGSQLLFGAICEYKVQFEYPTRQTLLPFPSCQTPTFGPTEVYKNYPIESRNLKSAIYTDNGTVEIKFLILKPDIRVMAKLISNTTANSDQLSEQCIIQRYVAHEEVIISVYLPARGEYGLEVYANNAVTDGNSFYVVWQYFLVATAPSTVTGLPSLPLGFIGPFEPKFTEYGLNVVSHRDPYVVVAPTGDLCIEMSTSGECPVRIMTQLIHCSGNVSEQCPNQVLQQAGDHNNVQFLVRLPKRGFYRLQIYALPYSETRDNLPGVFNYLLLAQHALPTKSPFPQQFAQWKEGCHLYEPMNGVLGDGVDVRLVEAVKFRMSVPRASAVAVVVGGEWTRLARDSRGVWTGQVDMRLPWGQKSVDSVTVCANYGPGDQDSYVTILKYATHQ